MKCKDWLYEGTPIVLNVTSFRKACDESVSCKEIGILNSFLVDCLDELKKSSRKRHSFRHLKDIMLVKIVSQDLKGGCDSD